MKLLRIKWENILCMIYGIFYIIKSVSHIQEYGFNFESDMAIFIVMCILLCMVYIITLNLRRDLLEKEK